MYDPSDPLKALGNAIRARRAEKGLSQEELALASGLDRTYVGGVERGERNLSFLNITKLAKALDTPASALIAMSEKEQGG